jgi:hypothetical protein
VIKAHTHTRLDTLCEMIAGDTPILGQQRTTASRTAAVGRAALPAINSAVRR